MKKYVVYLTHYKGNLLPPYYIGSTTENKILNGKYFGSVKSKKWGNNFYSELKNNKELFKVEILSYHNSRKEALEEELKQQIINDVVISKDYFNESFAKVDGYFGHDMSGKNHPQYGKKMSDEIKEKISKKRLGYKFSEKAKNKMSESKIGNRNSFFGKKHSEETKKKNSEKMKRNYELLSEEDKLNNILNQKGRKNILQFDNNGNFVAEYLSIRQVEKITGFKRTCISYALNGKTKQSYGYVWKYKNE